MPWQTPPVARFVLDLDTHLTALESWVRLWDLRAHDEVIPLTRLSQVGGFRPLSAGARFTAHTGVLGVGVADSMEVVEFTPPRLDAAGTCRIVKTGAAVRGTVLVVVSPASTGSHVRWEQDISLSFVPGLADPLTARVARAAYARTVSRLLARAPTGPGAPP